MKRFLLICCALLFTVPFGLLLNALSASAASIYDDNYKTTSELIVESNYSSCEAVDIKDTYFNIFDNRDNWEDGTKYDQYIELMRDAVNDGSVSISSYNQLGGVGLNSTMKYANFAYINGDTTLNWNSDNVTLTKNNTNDTGVYINLMYKQDSIGTGGCEFFVRAYDFNYVGEFTVSTNDSPSRTNYVKNFLTYGDVNFNYPSGYEGEAINEIPPEPEKHFFPIVAWNYDGNNRIFATAHTDESVCIPFSNGGCYNNNNLLVKWELIDNSTNTVIKEQTTQHWSEKFEYDELVIGTNYTLRAKYIAPTHIPEPPVADNVIFDWIAFEIDTVLGVQSGSQMTQDCNLAGDTWTCTPPKQFKECFKPEFPYVDLPSCLWNAQRIIEIISFDRVQLLPYAPKSTNQCKQLETIGEWIHLENKTICPQFSENVRNAITPFITVALSLLIITFISRIARSKD